MNFLRLGSTNNSQYLKYRYILSIFFTLIYKSKKLILYYKVSYTKVVVFVSFDFDRTLGDFSVAHGNAILRAIHETYDNKFTVNWFDLNLSGLTDMEIITNLVHNHGISFNIIFERMTECIELINEEFLYYLKSYPIELLEGVPDTLNVLYQNEILMGLTTGNIKSVAWAKTENTGIRKYFSLGGFGDEAYDRTQMLRLTMNRAIKKFNLSSNDIFIHVGDSVKDIISAIKVGFIPIGVTTGHYNKKQLKEAGALHVVQNLKEILPIINEITPIQNSIEVFV